MSERQAKTKRKNEIKKTPVKKKSALDIISNIIIVILILTVLGIGGWAVYSKFSQMPKEEGTTENITNPTISETAAEEGISIEEFLAKYGLSDAEGLTDDTEITEIMPLMTFENYAAFVDSDVETLKQGMGLTKDYSNDTLMSEIIADMTASGQEPVEETQTEE